MEGGLILLFVFSSQMSSIDAYGYTCMDAIDLETNITTGYPKAYRPVTVSSVQLQLGLMHISELNIVAQELIVGGFIMVTWIDNRLTWDPLAFGNMSETILFHTKIWTPPLLLLNNAANGIKMLNDDANLASVVLKVNNDGSVVWLYPINFHAQCSVNIQYYPFDYQECTMTISTWMYSSAELNLYTTDSSINLDLHEENGEWEIHSTWAENSTKRLYMYDMAALNYKIRLMRKYSYYVKNLILPVIILACMGPFVFILPVESGEKNGFALTVMLSLSVFVTMVSGYIPTTATHVCFLSVYLLVTFVICACETIMTVVTCSINEFHNKGYIPGNYHQTILRTLAKLTFYSRANCNAKKNAVHPIINKDKAPAEKSEMTVTHKQACDDETEDCTIDIIEYTYEEFAVLLDRLNFGLFSLTNAICTMAYMLYIANGHAF